MFTLKIETGNAAFHPEHGSGVGEVTSLIREAADNVARGKRSGVLLDSNGNTVGKFRLTNVKED